MSRILSLSCCAVSGQKLGSGILACGTYCSLLPFRVAVDKIHLVRPTAVYPAEDILVWDVFYPGCVVLLHIALVHYAFDLILRLAKVALLEIVQDDLNASPRT